jgi:Ca-activated chloride channel family protein
LHNGGAEVVVKVAALLAALVTLIAPRALAQDEPQTPQQTARPTFHSAAALVALNVTVQDRGAKFVQGLQPTDFIVYEDGVKQNVEFFESTRVPVDLIVLLDTSASMRDKLGLVHDAASGFIKTLRPEDRGAVVTFARTVTVRQPLTTDQQLLQAAIVGTSAGGNTCLNNAIYIALKEFGQAARSDSQVRRQAIVVLSDGADTASVVSFDDVVTLARQMGVSIYTVSLQTPTARAAESAMMREADKDADDAMKTLAKETGAQSFFPMPSALKSVYSSIAAELANQYSIGYVPVNASPDGRFHHVNVQVVTRPQLFSRTRLGYIAAMLPPAVRGLGSDR